MKKLHTVVIKKNNYTIEVSYPDDYTTDDEQLTKALTMLEDLRVITANDIFSIKTFYTDRD